MNDFREFQKQYNDYLCHAQDTGSSMKYGSKEYRKSGRRVYGLEAANMRPKDYIAKCVRRGMTNEEIIKQCETALDPGYNPTTDEKHFFMEVIRLVKNNIQHSYNDFCELHEDYLMHFGILGMKWGIRRYQNPDGSLTDEGKRRYHMSDEDAYREYRAEKKKIDRQTGNRATVAGAGSLLGGITTIASLGAAGITGPGVLAVPAIAIGGLYASAVISSKIGDKKISNLKKSYNAERIDKVDKIINDFSEKRVSTILNRMQEKGYDTQGISDSTRKVMADTMTDQIARGLGRGITVKDVQNSDPEGMGLVTEEDKKRWQAMNKAAYH